MAKTIVPKVRGWWVDSMVKVSCDAVRLQFVEVIFISSLQQDPPVLQVLDFEMPWKNSIQTSLVWHKWDTEARFCKTFGTWSTSCKASSFDGVSIIALPLFRMDSGLPSTTNKCSGSTTSLEKERLARSLVTWWEAPESKSQCVSSEDLLSTWLACGLVLDLGG